MSDTTRRYEPAGIDKPLYFGLGVIASIVLAAIAMTVLYFLYLPYARQGPITYADFGQPHLQANPDKDLATLVDKQRAILTKPHWRDREAGIAAIPIDAAMKVIAARGNNAYGPVKTGGEAAASPRPGGAFAPPGRNDKPGAGSRQEERVPE